MMRQLAWILLGGLAGLSALVFAFGDGDRRVLPTFGPVPAGAEPSSGAGLDAELRDPRERAPFKPPGESELEASRAEPTGRERSDGSRRVLPGQLAVDLEPRRFNLPPTGRKWTQEPELEEYYENGQLHFKVLQVLDSNGRWIREGPWEAWHENGQLHELGAYLRGREQGKWSWWYDNGTPMAEGMYREGRREGAWTFWHENGALMMRGRYVDGKGAGRWTHYDESGSPVKFVEMERGEVSHVEWL